MKRAMNLQLISNTCCSGFVMKTQGGRQEFVDSRPISQTRCRVGDSALGVWGQEERLASLLLLETYAQHNEYVRNLQGRELLCYSL